MTTKDVLALALEALAANEFHLVEMGQRGNGLHSQTVKAITAIKQAQQAQEPDHPGACKTCGNTYLASRTDVHKDKRPFIYCDCCGAMADSKTWYMTHGPAPKQAEPFNPDLSLLDATQESLREHMLMVKQAEPASCHQTGVCVRSGLAAENHARVIECARRLVEHADFALGGILSADSKAKDIPSKAVSQVKSRHLAALRDALPTPPEAA